MAITDRVVLPGGEKVPQLGIGTWMMGERAGALKEETEIDTAEMYNLAAAALGLGDALAGLRDGRLEALGLAAESRSESFPDVPVLAEAGIAVATTIRRGLAAPAPLPAEAEARLVTALRAVAADPEFAAEADQDGFFVAWLDGPGWTQAAAEERAALVALWARDPWLPTGAG